MDNLYFMVNFRISALKVLLQKCKSLSLIIAQGAPKREKIFFFQELDNNFVVVCLSRDGFNPFGYVIHSWCIGAQMNKERSHKVDALHIKKFYF